MNDTIFLQAPKDVFYCEGVIAETGECVPLTVFDKLVYFHMLDRKDFLLTEEVNTLKGKIRLQRLSRLTERQLSLV